jgi:glycosyltransferase involved in cell wall biosynthesis
VVIAMAALPMKILLIANVVDHGTRSIADSYARELQPIGIIEIPRGLKQLGLGAWWALGLRIHSAARSADVVVCLHHGALALGALFLPIGRKPRKVAITDWTRAFPSRRRDLYIRIYNRVYALLAKKYAGIFSPAPGLRNCYAGLVAMRDTLYPLPYPDVTPAHWPRLVLAPVTMLYIGANVQRKAGDVLLEMWRREPPAGCTLSFVSPHPPGEAAEGVTFLKNIQANTPEHRRLLEEHAIFILPTRHDAYGFAALEALNFGQVVVTTRFAGIASLVEEAGGLVGDSPEEAVRLAFGLAARPDEILRRRELCKSFMQSYPGRLESCLRQLLDTSSTRN